MHVMGPDTDVEDQTSTENVEMSDEILDGAEYVGEDDFGPAEADLELEDFGTGAIVASIHVDKESEEDEVIYMATMAMPTNSQGCPRVIWQITKNWQRLMFYGTFLYE
jgi:hypothetical protein